MNRTVLDGLRARVGGWAGEGYEEVGSVLALIIGYTALYLALGRLSFLESLHGVDITPWNPPAGLALTLLLVRGVSYVPLVVLAAFLSSQLLPLVSIPPIAGLAAALIIAVGYAGAAGVLRHAVRFDIGLHRAHDVVLLIIAACMGAGLVSLGFVATYAVAGVIPWADFGRASFQFWVGDAIGAVVLAPLLLVILDHMCSRRSGARAKARFSVLELVAQWGSIAAALALVFGPYQDRYSFQLFYLLFLPLVWIATRHGLGGASWAVFSIQGGLIAILEFEDRSSEAIRIFQLLMFAVAITGLMLGAVVSERSRVARALAQSQARLAAIFNAARDGVLTIDMAGRIEAVNPAVEGLFRRPAQRLVGTDIRNLLDASHLLERLASSAHDGAPEPLRLELDARREDGSIFPIELTAGHFGSGADEHHALVLRDITLRREAETQARRHESEVAQVSRASLAGEMASALAHEINQPLMAITTYARGCLRLLKQPLFEPAVLKEGVEQVMLQAERAGDILSRLREFLRTGACQRSVVNVKALLDGSVALAQMEAAQNAIDIEVRVAPGLPAVLADRIQIEQVLLNLLRNAIDAVLGDDANPRSIVIAANRASATTVEITVADSGAGLADEVASRLFEPFVTTKPHGMGLGLSISRSIVEAHEGHLQLLRTSGAGSIFAFDLPIADGARARAG